jgi:hypothetical protein
LSDDLDFELGHEQIPMDVSLGVLFRFFHATPMVRKVVNCYVGLEEIIIPLIESLFLEVLTKNNISDLVTWVMSKLFQTQRFDDFLILHNRKSQCPSIE